MLADIAIENLGVIPAASAEFSSGLTVLTGETGAGKTMVVTGLRLLSGGRADASRVRTGAANAVVEGRFITEGAPNDIVERATGIVSNAGGCVDENGEFLAVRSVSANGRSKAHLGGRAVPAATLGEFSDELLTIHGQNDQLRLLSPERQLDALDRFDPQLVELRKAFGSKYLAWKSLDRDLNKRLNSRRELAQEVDRLQFAINEIDEVSPEPGEDTDLVDQIRRLQDVDTLRDQAATALSAIDGAGSLSDAMGGIAGFDDEQDSASDQLGQAESALIGSDDPKLKELATALGEITTQLSEISMELGGFLSDLPADPQALDQLLTRQQQLKLLTRKYAADIDGVIEWRKKAQTRLDSIDISSEALDKLKEDVKKAHTTMMRAAKKLSTVRGKAATKLSTTVTEELQGLAMQKARFVVDMTTVDAGPTGIDQVEFQLAANALSTPRPLASSASGGELSRVMLALEVILAAGTTGTTLVFDEVDAGVGGRAAVEIGRRLARLANDNQVIVVTHLPQVAAYADTHLHVAKDVGEGSVTSNVESLTYERRIEELSRMLAGLEDTATGRAHAAELLERAQREKQDISGGVVEQLLASA
ncbi:DNA repair protein RecN [Corynebacterium deserti GIMN1.010]|uniref:DNA repair protein RecN n=1 Tax=Corynebacterium deserti GIMN1.010 TaxID=931089 RepID=A0A0M4CX48_9CORY|nr:DNA repair protein RecN [Corynebacterium deserti]ALC05787.1 DNA repair protein RecN [Corynebacterium deserti GIMN1.010]